MNLHLIQLEFGWNPHLNIWPSSKQLWNVESFCSPYINVEQLRFEKQNQEKKNKRPPGSSEVVDAQSHLCHSATAVQHWLLLPVFIPADPIAESFDWLQVALDAIFKWILLLCQISKLLIQRTLLPTRYKSIWSSTWSRLRWFEDLKWLMSWSFVSKVRLSLESHFWLQCLKSKSAQSTRFKMVQILECRTPDAALSPTWSFLACGAEFTQTHSRHVCARLWI